MACGLLMDSPEKIVQVLRQRMQAPVHEGKKPIACDVEALAALLPAGGFQRGSLVEWETDCVGSQAITLAMASLRAAVSAERPLVIVDGHGSFFPSVSARACIPVECLLLIRPASSQEALWATEQALRCRGVGVVLCLGLEISSRQAGTVFRRFQRAVETGQTLGMFVHSRQRTGHITWSDLRLRVEPQTTRGPTGQIHIAVRLTGGRSQGLADPHRHKDVRLMIDEWTGHITDETFRVPLAPSVASAAFSPGLARA